MSRSWVVALAAVSALSGAGAARAEGGVLKKCVVGQRVADRENKTGVVVEADSSGTSCNVDMDDGRKRQYFLMWMLHEAGKPMIDPAQIARVRPGTYSCYAGSPLRYTFNDVIVTGPGAYRNKAGNKGAFSYSAADQKITWVSGPLQGMQGKYLEGYKIGLASRPTTFWATVCDLQTK